VMRSNMEAVLQGNPRESNATARGAAQANGSTDTSDAGADRAPRW